MRLPGAGFNPAGGASGNIAYAPIFDARSYGARENTKQIPGAVITNLSATFTDTTGLMVPTDAGKIITGNGIPTGTTILSVAGTTVTMSAAANLSATVNLYYGTDDLLFINATITAALQSGGPAVVIVTGRSIMSGPAVSCANSNGVVIMGLRGKMDQPIVGGVGGTPFGPLPQSAIIYAGQSASITDGATFTNQILQSPAQAQFTIQDVGIPVYGPGIPAGCHITQWNSATQVTLSHNTTATASGLTIVLGRPFLQFFESTAPAMYDLCLLTPNPLFQGIAVSAQSHSTAAGHAGFTQERCTVGQGDTGYAASGGWSVATGRQWACTLRDNRYHGNNIQVAGCDDGSFTNGQVIDGCTFDRYGTVGYRNPGEGTWFHGNRVGTGDDGHCQWIDMSNGVQGPGTTIDGVLIEGTWFTDRNVPGIVAGVAATTSGVQALPTATINMTNNASFTALPNSGTVVIATTQATAGLYTDQIVTYTGKGAGTLTGCSGGSGSTSAGGIVGYQTGAWIRVGGLNQSAVVHFKGGRGLGTKGSVLFQLIGASGLITLSIEGFSWNGGALVDFNGFTLKNLKVACLPDTGVTDSSFLRLTTNAGGTAPVAVGGWVSTTGQYNTDAITNTYIMSGGAGVTEVDIDNTAVYTQAAAALPPMSFPLNPGQKLTFIYTTTAPTVNKIPLNT